MQIFCRANIAQLWSNLAVYNSFKPKTLEIQLFLKKFFEFLSFITKIAVELS
jgi:hypothetical protein